MGYIIHGMSKVKLHFNRSKILFNRSKMLTNLFALGCYIFCFIFFGTLISCYFGNFNAEKSIETHIGNLSMFDYQLLFQ